MTTAGVVVAALVALAALGAVQAQETCFDVFLAWTGPGQIPNGVHTVYPPGAPGGLDVFCSFDLGDTLLPNVPDAGEAPVVESAAWTLVASEAQYHEQALTFLDQVVGSAADVNNGGVVNQGGSGGVGNGNVGPYFHPVNEADGVRYPYDRVLVEYGPQNGSPAHYYAFSVDWHFFSDLRNVLGDYLWHPVGDIRVSEPNMKVAMDDDGGAVWCSATSYDEIDLPGDTSWGITPRHDTNRGCGCNSGSWTGEGVFYGGYANTAAPGEPLIPPDHGSYSCTVCGCHGGGLSGYRGNGQPKGGITSNYVRMWLGFSLEAAEEKICENLSRNKFIPTISKWVSPGPCDANVHVNCPTVVFVDSEGVEHYELQEHIIDNGGDSLNGKCSA